MDPNDNRRHEKSWNDPPMFTMDQLSHGPNATNKRHRYPQYPQNQYSGQDAYQAPPPQQSQRPQFYPGQNPMEYGQPQQSYSQHPQQPYSQPQQQSYSQPQQQPYSQQPSYGQPYGGVGSIGAPAPGYGNAPPSYGYSQAPPPPTMGAPTYQYQYPPQ